MENVGGNRKDLERRSHDGEKENKKEERIMVCTPEGLLTRSLAQQPSFPKAKNRFFPSRSSRSKRKRFFIQLTYFAESKYLPAQLLSLFQCCQCRLRPPTPNTKHSVQNVVRRHLWPRCFPNCHGQTAATPLALCSEHKKCCVN